MKLDKKVVLITGGTSGIGAATARLFQAEGATVIVTGSSAKTVQAAKPTLPGVEVLVADQADTQASKGLVDQIKARYCRIDVLFVNAGVGKFATLDVADEAHFDYIFNINARGLYFMVKHAAPAIPDGGAILFTGSTAGSKGGPGMSVYSASKGSGALVGADVRRRARPPQHSCERYQPRPHRDPYLRQGRVEPRAAGRLAGKLEAADPAGPHRTAGGDSHNGAVPGRRRQLHHGGRDLRRWGMVDV